MQVEAEQTLLEQEYPPTLLALPHLVCRPVGPGDTVSIGGISELNHPFTQIIGRVLRVEVDITSIKSKHIPLHSSIDTGSSSPNSPLLLLQVFITKAQSNFIQPDLIWSSYDARTMILSNGGSECALANLLVWISPFNIEQIITVLHLEDVVNQVYGPVCNRVLTFFTTSNSIFDYPGGNDNHELITVKCHDYFAFGPSIRHTNPWNITETE